jgi:hypothetical protein
MTSTPSTVRLTLDTTDVEALGYIATIVITVTAEYAEGRRETSLLFVTTCELCVDPFVAELPLGS